MQHCCVSKAKHSIGTILRLSLVLLSCLMFQAYFLLKFRMIEQNGYNSMYHQSWSCQLSPFQCPGSDIIWRTRGMATGTTSSFQMWLAGRGCEMEILKFKTSTYGLFTNETVSRLGYTRSRRRKRDAAMEVDWGCSCGLSGCMKEYAAVHT